MAWNEFLELLDEPVPPHGDEAAIKAVATFYHALFTGLILQVTLTSGEERVGEWVQRVFRRLHHEKFLSSFAKLGLSGKPDPVAAAQYHYLSNSIGGVEVEFMPESDTKAWVRFCHPRWLYDGTALCGVPTSVSHGFLRGWYAQNGVSLGNDRMGFVCVSEDMSGRGGIGMTGYFKVFDHPLAEEERLQFVSDEKPPRFDAARAPKLDASEWPRARLLKANRNYAMDYVRVGLSELADLMGADRAAEIVSHTVALVSRQYYRLMQKLMGFDRRADDADALASLWLRLTRAEGDEAGYRGIAHGGCGAGALGLSQGSWGLMRGEENVCQSMAEAWAQRFEGMASVHNPHLALELNVEGVGGAPERVKFGWRVS